MFEWNSRMCTKEEYIVYADQDVEPITRTKTGIISHRLARKRKGRVAIYIFWYAYHFYPSRANCSVPGIKIFSHKRYGNKIIIVVNDVNYSA